ncbi:MAG: helix-turn-helix domain-containing protein [Candidatus Gracilibacteria bacterium]|jgi:predicted DNA-binding transcriptional regulator
MRNKLKYLLTTADLKPEEITIYLLLLKLQKTSANELIAKSNLNSMMVYRTLKSLSEKGLIDSHLINNKQKIYCPLSLESLIKKIDIEQKKLFRLKQSLKNLDSLLPYIDIDNEKEEENIEIREGVENFRAEYLKYPDLCKDEYLHIGSMENFWAVAGMDDDCPEERGFRRKRMGNGVYARVINTRSPVMEGIQNRDTRECRTTKMKDSLPIMNNYLAITETQSTLFVCDKANPRAIIIKNLELLNLQKEQFKTLWEK